MNQIIQKAVEERFDKKFPEYWIGTAMPNEIKFFIMTEIKSAINNTMEEAKMIVLQEPGVDDETLVFLRSSLDKLKV